MKKRLKLKTEYKIVLFSIVIISALGLLIYGLTKLDKDFMKSCMSQGYSEKYCIEHK